MSLHPSDLNDLKYAKLLLENPGLAAKLTNAIGSPIEKGFALLPANWNITVAKYTKEALQQAILTAVYTMDDRPCQTASNIWHKLGVAVTGGIGGFFGFSALAVELPVSTTIMLRSIADIARNQGEPIKHIESQLACIEVFALGGQTKQDNTSDSGYFAIRTLLARSVSEAAEYMVEKGFAEKGAPALLRLIFLVAERFGIQVTEKIAAQAIPILGAAGGAIINSLFIDHFQDMARGHFIVRRLERTYGSETVKELYQTIDCKG